MYYYITSKIAYFLAIYNMRVIRESSNAGSSASLRNYVPSGPFDKPVMVKKKPVMVKKIPKRVGF